MVRSNATIVNMSGGEVSPLLDLRTQLKVYSQSVARLENFLALPQGPARFRPGLYFGHYTRRNQNAVFIPFQFNDEQSYQVEATNQYFRFYRNNAIIVEGSKAITGATKANPVVVTSTSHGYQNGDEIFINNVQGMTELNGKSYIVKNVTANTFELQDIDEINLNGTGFTTYSSGGIAERIYEIKTPYLEEDLPFIQFAQNADTMYITNIRYEQRKFTRSGNTNWSLFRYTRIADPFGTANDITGITKANPAVVTYSGADNFSNGDQVFIDSVIGMTEINNTHFLIKNVNTTANTFELTDLNGVNIDSTGYTTYASAGKAEKIGADNYPRACTFTGDARVLFAATKVKPETIWGSRAPSSGAVRYDDFTKGSNDTDAIEFTLAPVHGQVDAIQWLANSDKFILAGTFGTVRRIYGATEQESITPTSVTAKSVNTYGCALATPVSNGVNVFYIQRGRDKLRSFEYDYVIDGYMTTDRNLVSGHITRTGLKQITNQLGSVNVIWGVRNDGVLTGMTYNDKEDIAGWHRQVFSGSHVGDDGFTKPFARCLWAGNMPRENNSEQLWVINERVINGKTRRFVEFLSDQVEMPFEIDFYTSTNNQDEDQERYFNASYEAMRWAVHLDAALTYDGSQVGVGAGAAITPGAATGTGVTFTASAAVFTSSMVGRQIWKKYSNRGEGGGRAIIKTFNSSTSVVCDIVVDFNDADQIPAGNWYLTATEISGLDHLEGETVGIVGDGATQNDKVVTDGSVTIDTPAAVCHVGLKYAGILETLELDSGGLTGSAVSKKRNVREANIHFLNTIGAFFGTSLYNLERIVFRSSSDKSSRGVPAFTGIKRIPFSDRHSRRKRAFVLQNKPLPCIIQALDVFLETTDE